MCLIFFLEISKDSSAGCKWLIHSSSLNMSTNEYIPVIDTFLHILNHVIKPSKDSERTEVDFRRAVYNFWVLCWVMKTFMKFICVVPLRKPCFWLIWIKSLVITLPVWMILKSFAFKLIQAFGILYVRLFLNSCFW